MTGQWEECGSWEQNRCWRQRDDVPLWWPVVWRVQEILLFLVYETLWTLKKNKKVMSMTEHVLQAVKDKVKMQTRISPFVSGSDVGGVGGVET